MSDHPINRHQYYDTQLSTKSLRRLWILTGVGLLFVPTAIVVILGLVPASLEIASKLVFLTSAAALLGLCFSGFVGRFWSHDKYLETWERTRKHAAMAFAFQITAYVIAGLIFFGTVGEILGLFRGVTVPPVGIYGLLIAAFSVIFFGVMVMHIYLLLTTMPTDAQDDLTLQDVI